jgi:hypothetical protein
MFLVHFFDQNEYEFIMSMHSDFAAAERAYEALLREYVVEPGTTLPPKADWCCLANKHTGEGVKLYRIECDGETAEEIGLSSSEDLATA